MRKCYRPRSSDSTPRNVIPFRQRGRLRQQCQVRKPADERTDDDLAFHARERRAQTKMDAGAEREVLVLLSPQVELVRILEDHGVAIGRADRREHDVAAPELFAAHLDRLPGDATGPLNGRIVTQQLFDRGADDLGVLAQVLKLIRMPQQRQDPVPDQIRRRLVSGREQQHAVGEQLVRVQRFDFRREQGGEQIVARRRSQAFDDDFEVSPQLLARKLREPAARASDSVPAPRPSRPTTS